MQLQHKHDQFCQNLSQDNPRLLGFLQGCIKEHDAEDGLVIGDMCVFQCSVFVCECSQFSTKVHLLDL